MDNDTVIMRIISRNKNKCDKILPRFADGPVDTDDVPVQVLDPKNTTNLKLNWNPVYKYTANPHILQYIKLLHCSWYTCRQSSTEIDFETGWLARKRGSDSEERHQKRGPFAILGLRKLEPVRARLPLNADSSRFEIQKKSVAIMIAGNRGRSF